jgi:hypothetical protein
VTAKAGLLRTGWPSGVCVGDYDNDGLTTCLSPMGKSDTVDLEIQWPAGAKQTFEKIQANQLVIAWVQRR